MSSLVELVRAAIDFESRIAFLTPSSEVSRLGPQTLERARSLYAAHFAALAPFAKGPLPEPRVEPHISVLSILRRLGFEIAAPPSSPASAGPVVPVAPIAPIAPIAPTAPPGPGSARPQLPPVAETVQRWREATTTAWSGAVSALRADPTAPERLRALSRALGVTPKQDDPYYLFEDALAEPLRIARWEHPLRGPSEHVEAFSERPHQTAARALTSHLRWLVAYEDDPSRPSPWWPILELWALGLWPVPAQDGTLLLLAAPLHEGRVPLFPERPELPWSKLGFRTGREEGWGPFDRFAETMREAGLGPVPGEFSVLHAW